MAIDIVAILGGLSNVGAFGFGTALMAVVGLALFRGQSIKEIVEAFKGVAKPATVPQTEPEILAKIYKCLEDIPVIKTNHLHELKALMESQGACANRVEQAVGALNNNLVSHNLQAFEIKKNSEAVLKNQEGIQESLERLNTSIGQIKSKLRIT